MPGPAFKARHRTSSRSMGHSASCALLFCLRLGSTDAAARLTAQQKSCQPNPDLEEHQEPDALEELDALDAQEELPGCHAALCHTLQPCPGTVSLWTGCALPGPRLRQRMPCGRTCRQTCERWAPRHSHYCCHVQVHCGDSLPVSAGSRDCVRLPQSGVRPLRMGGYARKDGAQALHKSTDACWQD